MWGCIYQVCKCVRLVGVVGAVVLTALIGARRAAAQLEYPNFDEISCADVSLIVPQSTVLPPPGLSSDCMWGPLVQRYNEGDGPLLERNPAIGGTLAPAGFRLNVNLIDVHVPASFLHPAPTLSGTSLPLLPPGSAGEGTGWSGLSRATVGGGVDLVTGAPLASVVDLELPFDGATFRLARTRSQLNTYERAQRTRSVDSDRWWDFTGAGWMIGENPLLLVDSATPDVVGNNPRTCWLVLDAFQSIPFQQIESSGLYEAPARFRARMSHNGAWLNRSWATPPTQYKITLYDGALTYTFDVHREDVPSHQWNRATLNGGTAPEWVPSSFHSRPFLPQQFADGRAHDPWSNGINPGIGMPYYATCSMIEDRYGHVAEMSYQAATWFIADHAGTEGCVECAQNCPSKGQLKTIRLGTRGANGALDVAWTLVYTHRFVAPSPSPANQPSVVAWNASLAAAGVYGVAAIDRIYAYEGDVTGELGGYQFTLPPTDRMVTSEGAVSLDGGTDPLSGVPATSVLRAWRHCVRYHYDYERSASQPAKLGRVLCPPTLLKTTVSHAEAERVNTSARAFVYSRLAPDELVGAPLPWLEAIFEPADVAKLLGSAAEDGCSSAEGVQPLLGETDGHAFGINDLVELRWSAVANCEVRDESGERVLIPGNARDRLLSYATRHWRETLGADTMPTEQVLVTMPTGARHYVDVANPTDIVNWRAAGVVRGFSSRAADGGWKHFRLYKYWLPPAQAERRSGSAGVFSEFTSGAPHRSVFVAPYTWRGYALAGELAALAAPPERLDVPRYLTIVEEFDSIAGRDAPEYGGAGHETAYSAPGLISRRVTSIGASGVVLKERAWEFTSAGAVATGSGIGEAAIYETAAEYLNSNADAGDNVPDPSPESTQVRPPLEDGTAQPLVADEFASLRNELLLVESRSLGWSVADLAGHGASDGMVQFFEYKRVDTEVPSEPGSGEPARMVHHVEQNAEGVARGSPRMGSAAKYYTQQHFLREAGTWGGAPCEFNATVVFTEPRTALLAASPRPSDSPESWSGFVPTFALVMRDAAQTDAPSMERRVLRSLTIGAPRRQRPAGVSGGEYWYFPIEGAANDAAGNQLWAVSGLVINPLAPALADGPMQGATLTYYVRDDMGRTVHSVLDAQPGAVVTPSFGGAFTIAGDSPWQRIAEMPAHNYVTSFEYSPEGRLTDTYLPNGRRWASRVVVMTRDEAGHSMPRDWWYAKEFIFSDLVASSADATLFFTESPAEIRDYWGPRPEGAPKVTRKVDMTSAFSLRIYDEIDRPVNYRERAVVKAAMDANGRIVGAELLEPDENGNLFALGTKEVNDLVDVLREREIDGSITRITRNLVGQPLRTYVGTKDDGWASTVDAQGHPLSYNMYLRSRIEYGVGVNDVRQPVVTREYTDNPTWARDHHGVPPANDADGIATVTRYDWRGRAVRVDSYAKGAPGANAKRRGTTLTYVDFAGRVVMEATFAEGALSLPAELDPSTYGPTSVLPSPAQLIAVQPRVTSLATTHYGPDGSQQERRSYDTGASSPTYIATFAFTGRGGQTVLSHTVGATASVSVLDGVGRTASTAVVAPGRGAIAYGYQLTRNDFVYDSDGNAISSTRWERVSEAGDVLTAANAVPSRTHNWFDASKRVVASLDLGAESGGEFAPAQEPWARYSGIFADRHVHPRIGCPSDDPATDPGALDDKAFDLCEQQGALIVMNTAGVPARGRLTINRYNKAGQLTHTRNLDGTLTRQRFDQAGRLIEKTENAWGSAQLRRTTTYRYSLGRLVEMTAARDAAGTMSEHTQVVYGAAVVDEKFAEVSRNNALVGRLYLPHPQTGRTRLDGAGGNAQNNDGYATAPAITLKYTFSGQIAERVDGRGLAFRYRYDDQSRLQSIEVGAYRGLRAVTLFEPGYPAWLAPGAAFTPRQRVGYVEYSYDTRGALSDVRAYDSRAKTLIVAHNKFDTDTRGDMLAEWQALSAAVGAQTPVVRYAWTHTPANLADPVALDVAVHRLASITYPGSANGAPNSSAGRDVALSYGAPLSLSSQLSTIATIGSAGAEIASFSYSGASRRLAQTWGRDAGGAAQLMSSLGVCAGACITGLDEFARLSKLSVRNGADVVLFGAEYSYDIAGNRGAAKITQSSATGAAVVNQSSQVNRYDELNRLIATQHGVITSAPGAPPVIDSAFETGSEEWALDLLGNWSGSGVGTTGPPGIARSGNLDAMGTPWARMNADEARDVERVMHAVDLRNAITGITTEVGNVGGGTTASTSHTVYDGAGNLIFDGQLVYVYDAWGRIVEVRRGTFNASVPAPDPNADTPPNAYARVTVGELIKRFAYDGLGRLVTTTTPLPATATVTNRERIERYIYDGVRRVQEFVSESPITPTGQPTKWREREYIWRPGDGELGLDELLAQFGADGRAWWVLQDSGGDIVALAQAATPQTPYARIAAQWTYDAYGNVQSAEQFAAHPKMRAGHKGLFLERCDIGLDGLEHDGLPMRDGYGGFVPAGQEPPRLVPFATAIYHVRNRAYAPHLGRWLQMDPNASGQGVLSASAFNGRGFGALSLAFGLEERYGDGMSLYGYLGGNPWGRWDAEGLYSWGEYWDNMKEGADVVARGYQTVSSVTDGSGLIQAMLEEMVSEYSDKEDADSDWAEDWLAADDAHSRVDNAWVGLALARGAYKHFGLEYWMDWAEDLDRDTTVMAGSRFSEAIRKLSSGSPLHHVATYFGRVGKALARELQAIKMPMSHISNALPLFMHKGPHDPAYHGWMLKSIQSITRRPLSLAEKQIAVRRFLLNTGEAIRRGDIDITPGRFQPPARFKDPLIR